MSNTTPLANQGNEAEPGSGEGPVSDHPGGFRALLTPHRSLGPQGFLILMSAIGAVSFGTGIVFLLLGAWPVLAFCGLDVALVYLAFKLNYRAARMHETVHLTEAALLVKRMHPCGKEENWTFHPYWVRLSVEENAHTERTQISLRSHGRELVIGHFLSDEEKVEFGNALGRALHAVRRGTASA